VEQMTFCFEKKAKKKKLIIKPVKEDAPDIVFELDKKLKLKTCSDFGLTKFGVLREAGAFYRELPIDESIVKIIRNKKQDYFQKIQETSVTVGFASEAAKIIENLEKELKRKNIKLKIDVGKEDLNA
jgi:predicted HTH domain antitoxin